MTYRGGVPRNREQTAQLIDDGWEYLLYAGALLEGMQQHEALWRDHEIGFAPRTGETFNLDEVLAFVSQRVADSAAIVERVERVLSAPAQEARSA